MIPCRNLRFPFLPRVERDDTNSKLVKNQAFKVTPNFGLSPLCPLHFLEPCDNVSFFKFSGNCYRLIGAEVIVEEHTAEAKEVKKVIIDDGALDKLTTKDEDFIMVGKGLCRGKDWQIEGLWPKDEGVESFERCALECKKDVACTAFDVGLSDKKGNKTELSICCREAVYTFD